MIALTTLLAPITAAQARASAVAQLTSYGIPAASWRAGGVFSTILTVATTIYAGLSSVVTSALNAGFLPTATGAWLVALAHYVYGVTAQSATFGAGFATFSNTGGGVYNYDAGGVIIQDLTSGNTFVTTAPLSLGAGTPSSPTVVTVAIQAQAPGSLGGAPAGGITSLVTVMASVTVTNAVAVLGLDADSDPLIRTKCLAAIAARSYTGPSGAYYAAIYGYGNYPGAVNAVTGAPVNINRIQVTNNPSTGAITVYVASPAGPADPNDVIGCQTAVTALAQPMGISATVVACTVVYFDASIVIWSTSSGANAAASILSEASLAIDNAVALYPIGGRTKPPSGTGYLYSSFVVAAASSVDPTIYAVDLAPWTSLELLPGQVAGVNSTITVRQVVA
jgi:hypothetical protein